MVRVLNFARVSYLAAIIGCSATLNAQVSATLDRFAVRPPEVEIRNGASVDLVAFAISMAPVAEGTSGRAPFLFFLDAMIDTDRLGMVDPLPLAPNQTFGVPVTTGFRNGHPVARFEPPVVAAAILADGSTDGDPALLACLISRRRNMLQAVELAYRMLADAGSRNVPKKQFVEQFQAMADSLDHWYLPLEQQVGRKLYESLAEKLMNLPQLPLGSAFPPTEFVEQETALLHRQRVALLESQPSLAGLTVARK